MALCPDCNKQELQAGESVCPHCSNKNTDSWLKFYLNAAGGLALGILLGRLNSQGNSKS